MCINTKMHIYTYTYCNYKYVYKANINLFFETSESSVLTLYCALWCTFSDERKYNLVFQRIF